MSRLIAATNIDWRTKAKIFLYKPCWLLGIRLIYCLGAGVLVWFPFRRWAFIRLIYRRSVSSELCTMQSAGRWQSTDVTGLSRSLSIAVPSQGPVPCSPQDDGSLQDTVPCSPQDDGSLQSRPRVSTPVLPYRRMFCVVPANVHLYASHSFGIAAFTCISVHV